MEMRLRERLLAGGGGKAQGHAGGLCMWGGGWGVGARGKGVPWQGVCAVRVMAGVGAKVGTGQWGGVKAHCPNLTVGNPTHGQAVRQPMPPPTGGI